MMQPPTLEQCRAMLSFIPANSREEWIRIGMALHSEFPGDEGFAAFDHWSKQAESYDAKNARAVWKSFKPGGGVSIGTLIDEAKRRGFEFDRDSEPAPALTPEQIEARRREQAERDAKAKNEIETKQQTARSKAETALRAASDDGTSAYLIRKKISAHGLKFEHDGTLLVPMRDEAGALWNVQRISESGDKKFLYGGRKTGLWHWVGIPPADQAAPAPLLIAEGYATAASVYEATGYPCAVAFDCGNLIHVAKAIRARYANALIVLCADDDANARDEQGKPKHADGNNPGVNKAKAAAKAVRGRVAIPTGLRDGDTDFNDLAISAGAEAVTKIIEAATSDPMSDTSVYADGAKNPPQNDRDDDDPYTLDERGVWTVGYDRSKNKSFPVWVCPPLRVRYRTRTSEGTEWGYLLEFSDPQGKPKTWVLPSRMLAGDGTEYRAQLASLGFEPPQGMHERRHLTAYIASRQCETFARTVKRIGWHEDRSAFVLPNEVIQSAHSDEPFVLQIDGEKDSAFRSRGTLESWRDNVAALAVGNSRLVFAISCAFAGALLEPAQQMGGGFHFRGLSSKGKSVALDVSSSVWGSRSFKQSWRATDSAIEWVCASRCDTFLPLDEIKQVDSAKIGECAYMIANGVGKSRSNQGGANRTRHEWRVLFVSNGELSVQDHIRDGNNGKSYAGQEVRVPDIPADAGKGHGMFEALHGIPLAKDFAKHLDSISTQHYGTAGVAFVRRLFDHVDQLGDVVRERVREFSAEIAPKGAAEQVHRVADRFALVAVAGEMATRMGLTGWPEGEAKSAALRCFADWLHDRGGIGNREGIDALAHVRQMIATHGRGRYVAWERANDSKAPNVPNALGYRRKLSVSGNPIDSEDFNATGDESREVEYVHERETFKREFCGERDMGLVLSVLSKHGHLRTNPKRNTLAVRLPGTSEKSISQCIVIKSSILTDSEANDAC